MICVIWRTLDYDEVEKSLAQPLFCMGVGFNIFMTIFGLCVFADIREPDRGIYVPEKFGGLELDKTTSSIIVDCLSSGESASIMVTISAHTGIATLPIIWYGNDEQKQKYLPKLTTGEFIGCFALTEPGAGSDVLAATTKAELNQEKTHYILNGQKIYITNGSWAQVCITFAKIDGKMTGFILDKECEGWVIGAEEKKMGIKGSSTTTMYFENCKVPVENMLGSVGEGGHIAFNVLYAGRWKLGFSSAAGCMSSMNGAYKFALERKQFSRSITKFDMIKRKFANMVIKAWESDTLNYATTGSIDHSIAKLDKKDEDYYVKVQKIIEDHAIEASICKVLGSDALAYCVDESVQIFGGAGFIEEYPAAGVYRDERINRIFEGTNEINRLLVAGTFLKKAILEEIPIRDVIFTREKNMIPDVNQSGHELETEMSVIEYCRSLTLKTLNNLINIYGQDLKNKQWVLEPLADVVISLSVMHNGFCRYNQLESGAHKEKTLTVLKVSISEHYNKMIKNVKEINCHIMGKMNLEDDNKNNDFCMSNDSSILALNYCVNTIALKKEICDEFYKNGKYYLNV